MPHSRRAAQHSVSRAFCPATSRPPSVVTSVRFSGTRHTSCGRTWRAMAIISSVAAISRFMRVCSDDRKRCTSWSWMWRRSSRRCSVMLSAPACSATSAACSGSGYGARRACRSVATWSMLTPSLMGWVSCTGSTSVRLACVRAHLESHLACPQRPAVEQPVERRPQQPARIREAARIVEFLARERQQRRAAKYQGSLRHSIDRLRAALDAVAVAAARIERLAARRLVLEIEAPAEFVEQPLLEQAQRPAGIVAGA